MYGLLNLIASSASLTIRLLLRASSCAASSRLTASVLGRNINPCFRFLIMFLSLTCYIVSQIRVDVNSFFLFYSHSQHCHWLMSSHSRASPMVMVVSLPHPQQVTALFSSFNQGSTLSTDISPPFAALLRIPSLIALALSLITGNSIAHQQRIASFFFTFLHFFFDV